MFLGWCVCGFGVFQAGRAAVCLRGRGGAVGGGWSTASWLLPQAILLLAVPGRLFCFGSLVILDVVCRYLSLVLCLGIEVGKSGCWLLD